jgi:hypothetical protein
MNIKLIYAMKNDRLLNNTGTFTLVIYILAFNLKVNVKLSLCLIN